MYDILYFFSITWSLNVARAETTISRVITAENPGCTLPKLGLISYPQACNRDWGVAFALDSDRSPLTQRKPVQKLHKTNHEQPHFRADFAAKISSKTRSCGASVSPLPPNFDQKCCISIVAFFRNIFPSFLPFFSLVRSPKNRNATLSRKMKHLRDPFRALRRTAERPYLSHRNDEPESPGKAVQNGKVRASPHVPASPICPNERIPNGDELSYDSTNDNTATVPQSALLQRRRQFPFLAPNLCPHPKSVRRQISESAVQI